MSFTPLIHNAACPVFPTDYDTADTGAIDSETFICAPPETLILQAIELRHDSGLPLLLVEDGRFPGIVRDDEIYRGLLRKA